VRLLEWAAGTVAATSLATLDGAADRAATEVYGMTEPRAAGMFGKLPAKHDERTLRFSALLAPSLPPPPPSFDALLRVRVGLKLKRAPNVSALFPMDGNDTHGDCTIAAAAHAETLWEAFCGKRRVPRASTVLRDYFNLSGGEDSGLVELDVLNRWRQGGITGEKILAYAAVDRHNLTAIQQAISTFGGVYIGFETTIHTLSEFRHHQPWTGKPPKDGNGHAVFVTGYDINAVTCLTWGAVQNGTWEWWEDCVDEVYAILPGEGALAAFCPGLDLAALREALRSVTA
jgi:hypothetical protein